MYTDEFIEKYKDLLEHNKELFDGIKLKIGDESADVAAEFWKDTYWKSMEISRVPETSMPLLYAFYAGFAYAKTKDLNDRCSTRLTED